MARIPHDYEDLPDGIVKLPPEDPGAQHAGCGVRGCLYAVMALFVVLLVGMVLIALFRPWPAPPPMMGR